MWAAGLVVSLNLGLRVSSRGSQLAGSGTRSPKWILNASSAVVQFRVLKDRLDPILQPGALAHDVRSPRDLPAQRLRALKGDAEVLAQLLAADFLPATNGA